MEEQGHFISVLEKRSETSFDESQAVQFFQTALAERDEQINALHAQVQACQRSASQLGLEKDGTDELLAKHLLGELGRIHFQMRRVFTF